LFVFTAANLIIIKLTLMGGRQYNRSGTRGMVGWLQENGTSLPGISKANAYTRKGAFIACHYP